MNNKRYTDLRDDIVKYADQIWPGQHFPEWDAERCFALFVIHHHGENSPSAPKPSADESDEFLKQLMLFVALYLGRNRLIDTLEQMGIGAADLAQEIAYHAFSRAGRFKLKNWEYKVYLSCLNTSISRKVADAMIKAGREPASDVDQVQRTVASSSPVDSLQWLANMLGLPQTRLMCCAGLLGDREMLLQLTEYQTRMLLEENRLERHENLRPQMRDRVTVENHGIITTRLIRTARNGAAAANN